MTDGKSRGRYPRGGTQPITGQLPGRGSIPEPARLPTCPPLCLSIYSYQVSPHDSEGSKVLSTINIRAAKTDWSGRRKSWTFLRLISSICLHCGVAKNCTDLNTRYQLQQRTSSLNTQAGLTLFMVWSTEIDQDWPDSRSKRFWAGYYWWGAAAIDIPQHFPDNLWRCLGREGPCPAAAHLSRHLPHATQIFRHEQ